MRFPVVATTENLIQAQADQFSKMIGDKIEEMAVASPNITDVGKPTYIVGTLETLLFEADNLIYGFIANQTKCVRNSQQTDCTFTFLSMQLN